MPTLCPQFSGEQAQAWHRVVAWPLPAPQPSGQPPSICREGLGGCRGLGSQGRTR